MLQKLKQMYLRTRIDRAWGDLEMSLLGMRDNARKVRMHAVQLESLIEQAGPTNHYYDDMVTLSLAKSEARNYQGTIP